MTLPQPPAATPTLLLYSIAIGAILVYAPFLVVAYGRLQASYDMAAPRAMFDKLPLYAQRATWAHENAFESFTLYAAAALTAYVSGVDTALAGWVALAYLTARSLYPVCYILGLPLARSLMFAIGSLSIATLFVLSLQHLSR